MASISGSDIGTEVGVVGFDVVAALAVAFEEGGGTGGVKLRLTDLMISGDDRVVRNVAAAGLVFTVITHNNNLSTNLYASLWFPVCQTRWPNGKAEKIRYLC